MMETMGRTKRPRRSFTKALKTEVVELVRQPGNTVASVARDLELMRPGFGGGSDSTERWTDASTEEVSSGVEGAGRAARCRGS